VVGGQELRVKDLGLIADGFISFSRFDNSDNSENSVIIPIPKAPQTLHTPKSLSSLHFRLIHHPCIEFLLSRLIFQAHISHSTVV
jgi:hypothetical protein